MKWSPDATSLFIFTLLLTACLCSALEATVAYVSQTVQANTTRLLPALKNPKVNTIVLVGDYSVGTELDAYLGSPLQVFRNITVTGLPGQLPIFDLQFKPGVIDICSNCVFSLQNLVIANETARGSTGVVCILRGHAGSRVDVCGGFGWHLACPPTAATLEILNNTQRSPLWPKPGDKQLAGSVTATYKGVVYPEMLRAIDISADMPLQLVSGNTYIGGYAIRRRNTTLLCDNIISAACLAENSPEACVAQLTDRELKGDSAAAAAGLHSAGGGQTNTAAIAAPVAVGGTLLLAATAVLLYRRHQRKRRQPSQQQLLPTSNKQQLSAINTASDARLLSDQAEQSSREASQAQVQMVSHGIRTPLPARPRSGPQPGEQPSRPPPSRRMSWEVAWSETASAMQWVEDTTSIELGPLLGAGSFARVFKAKWAGIDVAVKIIQHDSLTAGAVANEVQLMMRLNHPNIVRAYHCVTKQLPQLQRQHIDFGSISRASSGGTSRGASSTQQFMPNWQPSPQAVQQMKATLSPWPASAPQLAEAMPMQLTPLQEQQQQVPAKPIATGGTASPIGQFLPRPDSTNPNLSVVIPVHRLPSGIPPTTPSNLTPGYNIASSVISSLLPSEPGTTGFGTLGALSGDMSLLRTLSGSIVQARSGGPGSKTPLEAAYVRKGDHQGSSSDAPQTLGQPQQRQQQQQQQVFVPPAVSSPGGHSSTSSAVELSMQQQRSGMALSTIYSANGSATTGTFSDSPAGSGGAAGAAGAAAGTMPDHLGQRHMGTFETPILESTSSRGSIDRSTAVAAAAAAARWEAEHPGSSGNSSSATPPAAAAAAAANSPAWPVISSQQEPGTWGDNVSPSAAIVAAAGEDSPTKAAVSEESAIACETWLVTELCDRGTLARVAADWRPSERDEDMLRLLVLLLDVARGLKLLHAKNIVHADLTAHNILCSSSSTAPHGLVAKIADLGLSRVIKQQATHRTTRTIGTLSHQPPELLRDGHSSTAVDIYSFGIMMWELYTGEAAFARMRYGQIYHQVVLCDGRPAVPAGMSDDYHLLMASCWSAAPEARPSVDMLLHCLELMIQDRQDGIVASP